MKYRWLLLLLFVTITFGFITDISVVTKSEQRPDNLYFACRLEGDSSKAIIVLELEKAPASWKKLTKDLPRADYYIVEKDDMMGLIFDGRLLYFGDVSNLSKEDLDYLIEFFLSEVGDRKSKNFIQNKSEAHTVSRVFLGSIEC